jgi:hypothetical protein
MAKRTYAKKYKVGEVVVPGVTTVIKTSLGWGMHALIAWSIKQVKEGKDPKQVMQEAADAGTLAHTLVENWACVQMGNDLAVPNPTDGYSDEQIQAATNAYNSFQMWREGSKLVLKHSELEESCRSGMFGGTIDLVFQDELGSIHIADLKTTNHLQVAAYTRMYEENHGLVVRAAHMLRFGKSNNAVFHHTSWDQGGIDVGYNSFLHLRALYDAKKIIEGLV